MKYAAIADWAPEKQYPVTFMCAQLAVTRQGYYRWLASGPSERDRSDRTSAVRRQIRAHPIASSQLSVLQPLRKCEIL